MIFFSIVIYGQNHSNLTKEQMYQDFDTLVYKIQEISPHLVSKKIVWNYDILKTIKPYRKEIDTITSYSSFFQLVDKTLSTCQDGHTSLMDRLPEVDEIFDSFNFDIPTTLLLKIAK